MVDGLDGGTVENRPDNPWGADERLEESRRDWGDTLDCKWMFFRGNDRAEGPSVTLSPTDRSRG
jgi:hypothetical protein